MKRTIATVVAVLLLSGCTPPERTLWNLLHGRRPGAMEQQVRSLTAEQILTDVQVLTPEQHAALDAYVAHWDSLGPCEQVDAMIDDAGLPQHFHQVMRRESGCNSWAVGPNGEIGALQIKPGWAASCGIRVADLYDRWKNILCGVYVFKRQGPGAWTTW